VHVSRDILEAGIGSWKRDGSAMTKKTTTKKLSDNPKRWRAQAEKARRHAEQVSSPEIRQMMLELKRSYERLARRAEKRLNKSKSPN
jgi:hypothetical protein